MAQPRCVFAFTPDDPVYPPYVNLSDVDGKLVLTVRGEKKPPTDDRSYEACGETVSMTLPEDQALQLAHALRMELMHRWLSSD